MGHLLEIVRLSVGKVIHGIYVPFCPGTVVRVLDDTIHDGVAEVHIGRRHIYLGTQREGPLVELTGIHAHKEVEVFFDGAVAIRALRAGARRRTLLCGNLFGGLLIDIGFALFYHPDGQIEKFREIVGSIIQPVSPIEAEPMDVFFDGIDILYILFYGVCIVKTKVTCTAITLGNAEIYTYSFGMTYMEIPVRLGRETGIEPASVFPGSQVGTHYFFYKINRFFFFGIINLFSLCHIQKSLLII